MQTPTIFSMIERAGSYTVNDFRTQIESNPSCLHELIHEGLAPLMLACGASRAFDDDPAAPAGNQVIKIMIDKGANIEARNAYGFTALMMACINSNTASSASTVKLLLESGAKVDAVDCLGRSSLVLACMAFTKGKSDSETIMALIDAGADVNITDNHGVPSIVVISEAMTAPGAKDILKALIEAGTDLSHETNYGHTALMAYVKNTKPNLQAVQLLLESGADPNQRTRLGTVTDYLNTSNKNVINNRMRKIINEHKRRAH